MSSNLVKNNLIAAHINSPNDVIVCAAKVYQRSRLIEASGEFVSIRCLFVIIMDSFVMVRVVLGFTLLLNYGVLWVGTMGPFG